MDQHGEERSEGGGGTIHKDASHIVFYGGLLKGMGSAVRGVQLFFTTPILFSYGRERVIPLLNVQVGYMVALLLLFTLAYHTPESFAEVFGILWKWSRMMTVILTTLLEVRNDIFGGRRDGATLFDLTLEVEGNKEYSEMVRTLPKAKKPIRYYVTAAKRVLKLILFKMSAGVIMWVIPSGYQIVMPVVRFATMRGVLGVPLALSIASIYALPPELLHDYWIDDVLVSFGESLVDADDQGLKLVNGLLRKLDLQTRSYVQQRFRGYIIGLGFVFSFLAAVPFLGIPMSLIAECGAASLIVDITRRNLTKHDRLELPGEALLAEHDKMS